MLSVQDQHKEGNYHTWKVTKKEKGIIRVSVEVKKKVIKTKNERKVNEGEKEQHIIVKERGGQKKMNVDSTKL